MPTLYGGITTALTAILANTHAIQVVNQNVSNVNTPGYRKQMVLMSTSAPIETNPGYPSRMPGQLGTGVQVDLILHNSNALLDARYRAASGESNDWQSRQSLMSQVETNLQSTSTAGLPSMLDQFWANWSQLASDPSNIAIRQELLGQADSLANNFNTQANQLLQLRGDQNAAVSDQVDQINSAAQQIADLNGQIAANLSIGEQPNDLIDRRDLLTDQLAQSAGAVSYLQKDGTTLVSIGGTNLVTNRKAYALTTVPDTTNPANNGMLQVQWADGTAFTPPSGSLNGLLSARDQMIPAQLNWLDTLATQLATSVNGLHSTGLAMDGLTPGGNFFDLPATGSAAGGIKVRVGLTATGIAVNKSGLPGDNTLANQIAALKLDKSVFGSNVTFNEYLNNAISTLGTDLKRTNSNLTHNQLIVDALTTQRSSESGVSLDEEAANLAKYERSYQAAGRLMSAFDQMLDMIINNMGR